MTILDFFHFDKDEYAHRISDYDTERLRKQDVVKLRQQISAGCSIGFGVGATILTTGTSLPVAAYGARRAYVAYKKQHLIKQQLKQRGIAPHQRRKRDYVIPILVSFIGVGVGFGVDEIAHAVTSTDVVGTLIPSGKSTSQVVFQHTENLSHNVVHGIHEQLHEVTVAGHGLVSGHDETIHALTQNTPLQPLNLSSSSELFEYHIGMATAQQAEHIGASSALSSMSQCTLESTLGHARAQSKK